MDRKRIRRLLVLGLVLGLVSAPVVAAVSGYLSNSVTTSGPVPLSASNGPTVTLDGGADVNLSAPFPDSNTVRIRSSAGNITFESAGKTNASIDASAINGTWTNVTGLDVSSSALTIAPEDKRNVTVSGSTKNLSFRDATIGDGQIDFVYGGSSGKTNLTLHGLASNVTVGAVDASTHEVLDSATTSSNGTVTLSMHNSQHEVLLKTSSGAPSVSSPSPTGTLSTSPSTLSVHVSDPDFPNDNVSVQFSLDGAVVGSDSVTSSGTASVSVSNLSRGSHSVSAVATDQYGQSTTENWSFATPNRFYAANVSNASQIINDQNVTFTFYQANDNVSTRTTSNGSVSLSGLDTSGSIAVQVEAPGTAPNSTAYYTRTFLIENIGDQDTAYMLPQNQSAVFNSFVLNDLSGQFPASSTSLIIQRAVDHNGSVSWDAVAGDHFSADKTVTAYLQKDQRYRLIVVNSNGNRRVLGGYVAASAGSVQLTIGNVQWDVKNPETVQWSSRTINLTSANSQPFGYVHFQFYDPNMSTTNLHVVIHQQGNASNEIYNETAPGPFGTFSLNQTISGEQVTNETWVVEWGADGVNGTLSGSRVVSSRQYPVPNPFDSKWGPTVVSGVILFAAFIFGGLNSNVGAVVVGGVASVLWYIGWYSASAGVILLALIVGGLFIVGGGQGAGGR